MNGEPATTVTMVSSYSHRRGELVFGKMQHFGKVTPKLLPSFFPSLAKIAPIFSKTNQHYPAVSKSLWPRHWTTWSTQFIFVHKSHSSFSQSHQKGKCSTSREKLFSEKKRGNWWEEAFAALMFEPICWFSLYCWITSSILFLYFSEKKITALVQNTKSCPNPISVFLPESIRPRKKANTIFSFFCLKRARSGRNTNLHGRPLVRRSFWLCFWSWEQPHTPLEECACLPVYGVWQCGKLGLDGLYILLNVSAMRGLDRKPSLLHTRGDSTRKKMKFSGG